MVDTTTIRKVKRARKPDFRPDIQGLRAVAVLVVVANHAGIEQLAGGFVGVDVFFVISGFLITGLLVGEAQGGRGISLSNFYARRARRILPAATLVLAATVGAAVLFLGNVRASEVGREAFWSALFSVNWKFANDGTDYFASGLPPTPLQHYWSLAVEEQFYLVWPLLFSTALALFVARARARRRKVRSHSADSGGSSRRRTQTRRRVLTPGRQLGLAGVIGLLGAASLLYSVLATAASPDSAYFSTFTRIWELAIGALLAMLVPQLIRVPEQVQIVLSWLGLAGIAASAVLLAETTAFPGAIALLPVLSAGMVIVGGMSKSPKGAVLLLGTKPMRWVGDRSYSLYLWHWPILVIAAAYQGRELNPLESAVLVALAFLATMATYTFIEYPIHKGRLRSTRNTSLALWPVSFAFVALVSLIAVDAARSVPVFAGPGFAFSAETTVPTPTGGVPTPTGGVPTPTTDPAATTNEPAPPPDSVEAAVAEAVATARTGAPIPSTLSPTLDQLRADSWEAAAPCAAQGDDIPTEICGYGPADADRSIVIMGDSHAGMWVSTLREIAETEGWRFHYFVKGGCSSADIVPLGSGREGRQSGCREWRTWALDEIADLSPDIAILADRGDKPLAGPDGEEIQPGVPEHTQAWENAVESTVRTLSESAKRVVVLSETPVMDRDPVTCLGAANANLGECLTTFRQSIQDIAAADQRAASAAGGEYLDVNRWLCSDNQCPMVVSDIIVYTDGQHISRTFATALADTMAVDLGLT